MRRSLPFLTLAVACGSNVPPAPSLVVTLPAVYRSSTGATPVPGDSHRYFVEAQVADGSGGIRRVVGEPDGPGVFRLDNVQGEAWVRLFDSEDGLGSERWVWTDSATLDLGADVAGRADRVKATLRPTTLVIDGTGLDAWQEFDEISMADPNLGFSTHAAKTYFSKNDPQPGATSLDALTLEWSGFPLADAAKGDRLWLTQERSFSDDARGLRWSGPLRAAKIEGLTQTDGGSAHAQITFSELPEGSYRLNWKRSAFAALRTSIHPTRAGADPFQSTWVRAIPGGVEHGRLYQYELPVVEGLFPPGGNEDIDLAIPMRNPYPANWLVENFVFNFQVSYDAPDAEVSAKAALDAEIGVLATTMPADGVVPLVSPVRAPMLAGKPFSSEVEHAGTTPVLSWQPPQTGTPTSYEVHVYTPSYENQIGPSPGPRVAMVELTSLVVPADHTSITLPAGILSPGQKYALRIRAVQEPGQDVRHAPFRHAIPSAWADFASEYVSP